ncbi:MAG: transporter [Desulfatitalea sp.]
MRTGRFGILIIAFTFLIAASASAATYGQTGFQIDWWRGEDGAKGVQYFIPIEAGGDIEQFSFKVLTAQVYNRIDPDDRPMRKFEGFVDTRLNLAYELVNQWPVDLLLALDFNLPTGKTGLTATQAISISDPDKVTITRMGEGFNTNPSLSLLKQWDALLATVGVGYIWRGEYDATDELTDYDPGDALNLTAEVDYNFSPRWLGRLFGSYTRFDTDQQDGEDFYEPGDVSTMGAGLNYPRAQWELGASFQAIFRDTEKRQDWSGVMLTEEHNSYGDEWIAGINGRVQLSDRIDLKAWAQYKYIAANDYPPEDYVYYQSNREKSSLGAELAMRLAAHWEAGLRLQGYSMRVGDYERYYGVDPGADFDGGTAALWITGRF